MPNDDPLPATLPTPRPDGAKGLQLLTAADLQDNLMVASNDLARLQRLLSDASQTLMGHFCGASAQVSQLSYLSAQQADLPDLHRPGAHLHETLQHLAGAVTALQFQDMASQLVTHTQQRLRHCADRLARDAMGDDDDGDAVVADAPLRPNPVTQDEMHAGSVELF